MKTVLVIIAFLLALVSANTETFQIKIPDDFPIPAQFSTFDSSLVISLSPDERANRTVHLAGKTTQYYVKLVNFEPNDSFFFKVCWPAIQPIEIDINQLVLSPDEHLFDDFNEAEYYLVLDLTTNYYPVDSKYDLMSVDLDFQLSPVRFGIPVIMVDTIIYIMVIAVLSYQIFPMIYHFYIS